MCPSGCVLGALRFCRGNSGPPCEMWGVSRIGGALAPCPASTDLIHIYIWTSGRISFKFILLMRKIFLVESTGSGVDLCYWLWDSSRCYSNRGTENRTLWVRCHCSRCPREEGLELKESSTSPMLSSRSLFPQQEYCMLNPI